MLVTQKYGNIWSAGTANKSIDQLCIEWHETGKRILHKTTKAGISITLKFLNANPDFQDGDILWQDKNSIIAVEIIPTDSIVIIPESIVSASALCYEIGNRHLPLFYEGHELLIPYDVPLHHLLQSSGYIMRVEKRKLNHPFKTTVLPHVQVAGNVSEPAKVLQLSTSS